MATHEMTIDFTKNVFALFNPFYINTAELNIFVQVKIKVVLFTSSITWPQIRNLNAYLFLVLAGQSLWLLLKWVLLPHHLHALPPTSTSAPSGAATASKCGAGSISNCSLGNPDCLFFIDNIILFVPIGVSYLTVFYILLPIKKISSVTRTLHKMAQAADIIFRGNFHLHYCMEMYYTKRHTFTTSVSAPLSC